MQNIFTHRAWRDKPYVIYYRDYYYYYYHYFEVLEIEPRVLSSLGKAEYH